jgi:hypothetical protein
MTVVKLSKSKKAIQIITDDGKVYQTSVVFMQGLLMGKSKSGFITTVRLPFNVAADRFAPSEVWDPDGIFKGDAAKTLTTTDDALSVKVRKKSEVKKGFVDKKVDW